MKDKIQMLTSSFVAKSENDQDDEDTEEPESHVPFPPEELKEHHEELRPKKDMIVGDNKLPRSYDYRDEFPMCNS